MLKKFLALLLAGIFCLSTLTACFEDVDSGYEEDDDDEKKENGTGTDKTTGTLAESELANGDSYPDEPSGSQFESGDFGGKEFNILHYGDMATDFHDRYIWSESFTGDAIGDAVKERNQLVEDKYNVVVTAEECSPAAEANARIQAGQVDFNLIYEWGIRQTGLALDGMFCDVHELDYVNLDKSYWVPNAVEGYTVADRMFVFTNMISMNSISWAGCYFFNKNLMDEYDITYPYEDIAAGNWTYDVLLDKMSKAERDVNDDGVMGLEDVYGGIDGENILMGVCDEPMWETVGGEYKVITYTESMIAAYNKYKAKCDNVESVDIMEYAYDADISKFPSHFIAARFLYFGEDHALFLSGALDMTKEFTEMKSDYGIVPVPVKSAGDDFVTGVDGCAPMFSIPASVADPDMTAMVLDYMAYESERLLLPAYYETVIQNKRVQDTRDFAMLDIIRDSVRYDWADIYMWSSLNYSSLRSKIFTGSLVPSMIQKYGEQAQQEMDDVIDTIKSIG